MLQNCVDHPVALMYVEIDPREYHRHRLFLALEAHGLRGSLLLDSRVVECEDIVY
jgi:hypothetical protein